MTTNVNLEKSQIIYDYYPLGSGIDLLGLFSVTISVLCRPFLKLTWNVALAYLQATPSECGYSPPLVVVGAGDRLASRLVQLQCFFESR